MCQHKHTHLTQSECVSVRNEWWLMNGSWCCRKHEHIVHKKPLEIYLLDFHVSFNIACVCVWKVCRRRWKLFAFYIVCPRFVCLDVGKKNTILANVIIVMWLWFACNSFQMLINLAWRAYSFLGHSGSAPYRPEERKEKKRNAVS